MIKRINKTAVWIFMLAKKYLKNPLFVLSILAIPAFVLSLRNISGSDEAVVRVALFANEDAAESHNAIDRLLDESGAVRFYEADTMDDMYMDVKNGYASCAYVFPDRLDEAVYNFINNKFSLLQFEDAIIKSVYKEKTNYTKISDEIVFSAIYENYAKEVMADFLEKNEGTSAMTDQDKELMESFFASYDITDEFFSFEYADGKTNVTLTDKKAGFLTLPIKGIIYTIILLSGMMGAITVYKDRDNGLFQSISRKKRPFVYYLYVMVPTVMTGLAGLAGIMLSNTENGIFDESVVMAVYVFLVVGFCRALMVPFKSITLYVSVIPIYLLMNLVFCPVFIDLSTYLEGVRIMQWLLPVSYGLAGMYNMAHMVIAGIALNIICYKNV